MAFILSAFADEIGDALDTQISGVKKHGIGYIEMRGVDGKNVSEYTPEEMKQVKKRLDAGGIRVSAIGSPLGKIKITEDMDSHIAVFRNVLELAKILETDYIRLFSFYIPEGEDPAAYRDQVLRRMERFVKEAGGSGVTLLHENEKGIYGDNIFRCVDILESIGSDRLRATFDPANFVQCGVQPYPDAYQALAPYIDYVHIKDALESGKVVPAGKGIGGVPQLLNELKQKNYQGFLSLEPHLGSFSSLKDLELDDKYKDLPEGGESTFAVAADALKQLLAKL